MTRDSPGGGRAPPRKGAPAGASSAGGCCAPCPPCQEERRRELEALRGELEAERLRAQEARRRAALEAREQREAAERERQRLADQLRSRWEQQRAREAHQLREAALRQREAEIRQLLRWKEAELREALELVLRERDATLRQARELQRQLAEELVGRGHCPRCQGGACAEGRARLQEVLGKLRWETDSEQAVRIRHFKAQLELERSLFLKYILQRFEGEPPPPRQPRPAGPPAQPPARPARPRPRSLESLLGPPCATALAKSRSLHGPLPLEDGKPPDKPEALLDEDPQPQGQPGVWASAGEGAAPTAAQPPPPPDWLANGGYDQLVKQNADLLDALADLERRCTRLKDENALLRSANFPEMQDKVSRLKRKNAELAGLAKRLEERAKNLQESGRRISGTPVPFALGRTKGELAEDGQAVSLSSDATAGVLVAKDQQLEGLQKESWELPAKLDVGKENTCVLGVGDFECLLRESQREVLRLQRQVMLKNQCLQVLKVGPNGMASSVIVREISTTAEVCLEDSLLAKGKSEMLSAAANGIESELLGSGTDGGKSPLKAESKGALLVLKKQLAENLKLCDQLQHQVEEKQAQCEDLERQLDEALSQNTHMAEENSRLQRKTEWAERMRDETAEMKAKLMQAVDDRNAATALAQTLEVKVEQLEGVMRGMRQRAERWQRGESEHKKTLSVLQKKEEEIRHLQEVQAEIRKGHEEAVQLLEAQVRELENQYHSQSEHFTLLSQELERLQTKNSGPSESTQATYSPATMIYPEIWDQEVCKALPCKAGVNDEDSASTVSVDALTHVKGSDTQSNSSGSESVQDSVRFCLHPGEDTADEREELETEKAPLVTQLENPGPLSLRVFLARYSYYPPACPDENSGVELPLTAGEYVYIYGEMDEDGFYKGELMDGRRGLVPSNLVEEVSGNSLINFAAPEPSAMPRHSCHEVNFTGQSSGENSDSPDEDRSASLLSSLIEDGIYDDLVAVPYPQNLTLIKQFPRSIIIGWDPPQVPNGWGKVRGYNVYVNTDLCQKVTCGSPMKTVIGNLDLTLQTYRISVQSVTDGGNSDKMQCTFLVGNGFPIAPTLLKLRNLTATSAKITWLPSNSNYAHRVYRNEMESDVSKPGVYWYTFQNLTPSTRYDVRVETIVPKEAWVVPQGNLEQKSAALTFTTPSARLPDAPLDVQAQLAPSADFLVVNWLPVTIDAAGSSNGVKVMGYAIYISGEKVAEIASPTAGSISLDISQLHGFQGFRKVSVRTLSPFGESEDSVPALIPSSLSKASGLSDASSQASELTTRGSESGHILATNTAMSPGFPHLCVENPTPSFTIHFSSNCTSSVVLAPETVSQCLTSSSALAASRHARNQEEGDSVLQMSAGGQVSGSPVLELSQEEPTAAIPTMFKSFAGDSERERPTEHWVMKKTKSQPHNIKNKGQAATQLADAKIPPSQSYIENGANPLILEPLFPSVEFGPRKGSYGDAAIQRGGVQEKPDPFSKSKDLEQNRQLSRELSNLAACAAETREDQRSRNESCQAGDYNFDLSGIEDNDQCRFRTSLSEQKGFWPQEKPAPPVEMAQDNTMAAILRVEEAVASSGPCPLSLPKILDSRSTASGGHERLFVALFDYNPVTMSPNSDGAEEELPFRQGQILKVTGDKDEDGFYRGECDGRKGYIPCNMVSEMHIESPEVKEQLLKTGYVQDEW
ncbi:peripheral-type benzodiazepine receptor-associated protein 1-like [Tiliqua scincoides]|uniref:peripheral-type benzodiazepine receptor-associated protein 1-like n=1 Tax=Tiliqua scincoides TaxID=71010 RepID=UPI003462B0A9